MKLALFKRLIAAGTLAVNLVSTPAHQAADSDALAPLMQVLKEIDDSQFQIDVLKGMQEGLKGRRNVPAPAGWDEVEAKLSQSPNPQVRDLAQSLSLTFGSANALAALRRQLMDATADPAARKTALDALVQAKDPNLPPLLHQLMANLNLRGPAMRALAAYDDPKTPTAILGVYTSLNAAEKRDALNTLASRASHARVLMAAIEGSSLPAKDLTAEIVRQLRSLNDAEINQKVEKLWGLARETEAEKQKEIARYKKMIQAAATQPDLSHGRALYARTCQQCHVLFDTGGKIGPDITGSNRADLDYILHNILDPNAEIPNEYRTSTVDTKDGRVLTGIITRQDNQAVTVVTASETIVVPRNEIDSIRQSEVSMMPDGLLANFSDKEVRDLVAYLRSPQQVPMLATPETLDFFFNGKDLSGWTGNMELWRVENGEIVGTSPGLKKNEFLVGPLLLGDFRMIVEVKLVPNKGNSGIQFRSETLPNGSVKGYQADIGAGWWGKLYEEHGRALLWKESGEQYVNREGWNTYEIVAVGSRILTAINGGKCVDLDDPAGARAGIVAFQLHSGGAMEIRFRKIELELNPKPELRTLRQSR